MNTGIRLGVMTPDPRLLVVEGQCPECYRVVRDAALGHIGVLGRVEVTCDCGHHFILQTAGRELDS